MVFKACFNLKLTINIFFSRGSVLFSDGGLGAAFIVHRVQNAFTCRICHCIPVTKHSTVRILLQILNFHRPNATGADQVFVMAVAETQHEKGL